MLGRVLLAVAVPAAAAFGWSRLFGRAEDAGNWAVLAALAAAALAWTVPGRDLRGLFYALWAGPVLTPIGAIIAALPTLEKPMAIGERVLVWACTYAVILAIARVAHRVFGRPGVVPEDEVAQPAGLIDLLLDRSAEHGNRGDAAMDLAAYDEPEAERALAEVGSDPATDQDLAGTCGESLAGIWLRQDHFDAEVLGRLTEPARRTAVATLEAERPEWAEWVRCFDRSQS